MSVDHSETLLLSLLCIAGAPKEEIVLFLLSLLLLMLMLMHHFEIYLHIYPRACSMNHQQLLIIEYRS